MNRDRGQSTAMSASSRKSQSILQSAIKLSNSKKRPTSSSKKKRLPQSLSQLSGSVLSTVNEVSRFVEMFISIITTFIILNQFNVCKQTKKETEKQF